MVNESSWPDVELFNAITEQAVTAAGVDVSQRVHITDIAGDPESYLLIDKDGAHEVIRKNQPRRNHLLSSVEDVVKFVRFLAAAEGKPIVWISKNQIVVTQDGDRLRGDQATYSIALTELFRKIESLGASDGYTQNDFLQLLRVDLARAFQSDELRVSLVRTIRQLKKQEQSNVAVGSGSYEVGLVSQANEAVAWPEGFFLQTAVFDDLSLTADLFGVEIVMDVRPENRTAPFKLSPVKADLASALQRAMQAVVAFITNELPDVPVFLGAPTASR